MKVNSTDPFKIFYDLRGKLTVIGARPGIGKSSFLLDIINNNVGRKLYFNLDTNRNSLKDLVLVDDVEIVTAPIMIEDIRKMCEAMSTYKLSFVLIDYLQLIGTRKTFNSFVEKQFFIISELKNIAVDFNVSVIVLSTLPRYIDQREDKQPNLQDVKTYVRLNADVIMFLYKNNFLTELIVAKNYNERLGNTRLSYDKHTHSFNFFGSSEDRLSFMNIFNENYY